MTFVSSMDVFTVLKIKFWNTENVSEFSEVQAIIKVHASLPLWFRQEHKLKHNFTNTDTTNGLQKCIVA